MAEGLTFEETKREYLKIFFALMIFTALTVFAAKGWQVDSSDGIAHLVHILVGLAIALIKAIMVVYVFMHIKFDHKLLRLCIYVPLMFSSFLMFALTVLGL